MIIVAMILLAIAFSIAAIKLLDTDLDILGLVSAILCVCLLVAVAITSVVAIIEHLAAAGNAASYQKRYESLIYQMENNLYDNDNDIGKRDLYEDIEAWNTDLAYRKRMQRDFWLGVFYPNVYDQFEFIAYPET